MGIKHIAAIGVVFFTVLACGTAQSANNNSGGNGETPAAGHAHVVPPPPAKPLRDGERFLEVGLQRAYQPKPPEGGTDEYRCFLVDPKFTEAAFITGSQFLPQNAPIVHHAILYSLPASEVEHAKKVDAASDGDGWQCFGGSGLSSGAERLSGKEKETFIGGWAPGNDETLLGSTPAGYPVQPGTQIVLQVHYNLLATNGKPGPEDKSSVRLRLMPGSAKVTPLSGALLPGPIELPCTAQESGPLCDREAAIADLVKRTGNQARDEVVGLNFLCNNDKAPVPGNTQHCDHKIRQPGLLYAVAPHMHLLGRSITVELNPGTPSARMLLDQPQYNFDDQSTHPLPEPVALKAGDTIRVTCTHDASLRSQLPELKQLKPRYVVWGDGTSDEMCLALLATAPSRG